MTALASQPLALPLIVLEPTESLDASSLLRFAEQLEEAVSLRPLRLVVDLGRCPSLEPQAVRLLADAATELEAHGGLLQVLHPVPQAQRMLSLVASALTDTAA